MQKTYKNKIKIHVVIQILLFIILILIDRITKVLAVKHLKPNGPVPIIKDVLELQYLENTGAAFGIFQNMQWMFYIITVIVLVLVIVLFISTCRKLTDYCNFIETDIEKFHFKTFNSGIFLNYLIVLLASGAIGNFIDRVAKKYVVDFIYFKPINFPIFNFADICVTLTALLLIIYFIFIYKEDPNFSILSFSKAKKKNEEH